MNIVTENNGKRRERTCMIISDTPVGRAMAYDIGAILETKSIKVTLDSAPEQRIPWASVNYGNATYPDYKRISDADPDYILALEIENGNDPSVLARPYHVKYIHDNGPKRDTEPTRKACDDMYVALKGVGCRVESNVGSKVIPWANVEDFENLREGNQVFYNLKMQAPVGYEYMIAEAIANGIAAYFGR